MNEKIFCDIPIYTMDSQKSVQEALVVVNGKIDFVGDTGEAFRIYPEGERVSFEGGCILPGFIDSHIHLNEFSLLFRDLDLSNVRDKKEIIDMIEAVVSKSEEDEWVLAGGCNFSILEEFTREDIDPVSGNNPLVLYSNDMNSVLINSKALLQVGIDRSRQDPLGGKIEMDEDNKPTGILRERAVDLVRKKIPEANAHTVETALETGIKRLFSNGITGFCDCSGGPLNVLLKNLLKLYRIKNLKTRALILFSERDASALSELGISSMFGNSNIRLGGIKIVIDGSFSSLTGYMSEPYKGSDSYGILLMEEEELYTLLRNSYSHYIWADVHAVGDKANTIALDCFERISKERGLPNLLKRIEHAVSLRDEDLERFSTLGVVACINPIRIPFDRERAVKALGPKAGLLYRFGGLVSSGAVIAIGSDAPLGLIDPFRTIYCAVERKDYEDGPEFRFYPKERISLNDAVYAYTMGGALACGMEKEIGSIEVGKYADFIHISSDLFRSEIENLMNTEVLHTVIDGEIVYEQSANII